MSYVNAVKFIDDTGVVRAFRWNADAPQVCAQDYLMALAEGDITNHTPWAKIGYAVMPVTTTTDLWSYASVGPTPVIPLIATAATLRVVTASGVDAGASIFSGTDDGGSTITLVDSTKNFTAGTPAAAGDCILLEEAGASPEWGFVTAVTNATTLAVAGGFSNGGSANGRTYSIIDYSPQAGCHAVLISGLDSTYTEQKEIVVTNGAVPNGVLTVKTWLRINAFRVIATGVNGIPTGAIILGDNATPPTIVYTYITAGFTRARNSIYTVPAGKTLYIYQWNAGFAANAANKNEYCRLFARVAAYIPEGGGTPFRSNVTDGVVIWYPYTEIVQGGSTAPVPIDSPTKIPAKTSLKVSGSASGAGVATSVLRGWLE